MIERAGEVLGCRSRCMSTCCGIRPDTHWRAVEWTHRRLQHFLGHASITNTVRYTAMTPEPFKDIWR